MGKGLCQTGIRIMGRLIDKIRYLLLGIALPKEQFYIQAEGFHSCFNPIFHVITQTQRTELIDDSQTED